MYKVGKDSPTGSAVWFATFLLLSPAAHANEHARMCTQGVSQPPADQPALLQWLLDNAPPSQLPAAQQRVLRLLCTAAKVCLRGSQGTATSKQLTHIMRAYWGITQTAMLVLAQPPGAAVVLPKLEAPSSSQATASQAPSAAISSRNSSGSAAATTGQGLAGSCSPHAKAVMSWLSLLGHCFLQSSEQLSNRLQQHAAGSAFSSGQQGQQQQHQTLDRAQISNELHSMCGFGAIGAPSCIVRVAVLLAADAVRPQQQLPKQQPLQVPDLPQDVVMFEEVDEALSIPHQQQQLLQVAGQQLAQHCSSLGLDLSAVQHSTWVLAEAAAAAAPLFYRGALVNADAEDLEALVPSDMQISECAIPVLLRFGLTNDQAYEALESAPQGLWGCPEITAWALLYSTPAQAYMQQLNCNVHIYGVRICYGSVAHGSPVGSVAVIDA
jgi:hypothetical protein